MNLQGHEWHDDAGRAALVAHVLRELEKLAPGEFELAPELHKGQHIRHRGSQAAIGLWPNYNRPAKPYILRVRGRCIFPMKPDGSFNAARIIEWARAEQNPKYQPLEG